MDHGEGGAPGHGHGAAMDVDASFELAALDQGTGIGAAASPAGADVDPFGLVAVEVPVDPYGPLTTDQQPVEAYRRARVEELDGLAELGR